jgi:hypothetical protein
MNGAQNVWWRPEGRSPFSLDPHRPVLPQIVSIAGQNLVIFGGPLLGLVAIQHYPPLVMDSTVYVVGASSIAFCFAASFAFFGAKSFPAGIPKSMELMFRAGWGLCMTFLVVGILDPRQWLRHAAHQPRRGDRLQAATALCRSARLAAAPHRRRAPRTARSLRAPRGAREHRRHAARAIGGAARPQATPPHGRPRPPRSGVVGDSRITVTAALRGPVEAFQFAIGSPIATQRVPSKRMSWTRLKGV